MSSVLTRRTRLNEHLPDGVDAILVTSLVNVRYLTGFTGSNGAALLAPDAAPLLATDGRYLAQAAAQAPDLEQVDARAVGPALVERAVRQGVRRLAIEAAAVTIELRDALTAAAQGQLELVCAAAVVEDLRLVKDDGELAALRTACEITDAAFTDVVAGLRPGLTERAVAWQLRAAIRDHGGEDLSFDSIVAFGPHSAIPHHEPTDRALARGDLVKMDFGALSGGYHADMTRTVVMGPPADWQRELHGLVHGIQQTCREATVVGALPNDLDALARTAIADAGHDVAHGLGHGVGLQIHERPFLTAATSADRLADRVPVTIEPGVYLPGRGGVRIEDTVVVGPAGATSLTTSSRELIEVA